MSAFRPKGTRDFLPEAMSNRTRAIEVVREIFELYGYGELQTPAFERIETLLGKYGDETDKLMFKILKRGKGSERGECDLALRYDLTIPLSRVIAMNNQIRMPFKRYQIQPVWRAERPQRGRFREFYQCDIDIVGTTSLLADAECLTVMYRCLEALGLPNVVIKVNDRRILADLAAKAGATTAKEEISVLIAIDKLDKIGVEGVTRELLKREFTEEGIASLFAALHKPDDPSDQLEKLSTCLTDRGRAGIDDINQIIAAAILMGTPEDALEIDPTLARGADYYTGPVFEASLRDGDIGSIAGGGRYDELIGKMSGKSVPTVGISLGLERVLVIMEERGLLPEPSATATVLVTIQSDEVKDASVNFAMKLRENGISTDLYLDQKSLKGQLKYANALNYRFVAIIGPEEATQGTVTLKNLKSGEQSTTNFADAAQMLNQPQP